MQKRKLSTKLLFPGLIFFLALGVRLFYFFSIKDDPLITVPILDAKLYLDWAQSILRLEPQKAFFTEPGYAYLLALILKLFNNSYLPLLYLQIVLGSLAPVLIYFTSLKLFKNKIISLVTGLIYAFLRPAIFYDLLLLKNSLEIFLITLFCFLLLYWWQKRDYKRYFVLGLLIGLTALVRANIFYTFPFLALAIIWPLKKINKEKIILASLLILGGILPILPVTWHNWQASHSLILINWSGGPNLYIGNWPEAEGGLKPPEFVGVDPEKEGEDWQKATKMYLQKDPSPAQVNSFWLKKTLLTILKDPGFFLKITGKKTILFLGRGMVTDNYRFEYAYLLAPWLKYLIPFYFLALFGLLGLFLSFFDKDLKQKLKPLIVIFVSYTGLLILTHIAERYRLSMAPLLAIFIAYFFHWLGKILKNPDPIKLISLLLTVPLLFMLAFVSKTQMSLADCTNSFGAEFEDEEQMDKARQYFEKGLQYDPQHIPSMQNLAKIYLVGGNFDQAIDLYRRILQVNPAEDSRRLALTLKAQEESWDKGKIEQELESLKGEEILDADYFEAMSLFRRGKAQEAQPLLEKVLANHPQSFPLLSNLGVVYKSLGDEARAEEFYQKALEIEPDNLAINYNLAKDYFVAQKYEEAIPFLEKINQLVPDYLLTPYFLGMSYFQQGKQRGALMTLAAFVEKNKSSQSRQKEVQQANMVLQSILGKMN